MNIYSKKQQIFQPSAISIDINNLIRIFLYQILWGFLMYFSLNANAQHSNSFNSNPEDSVGLKYKWVQSDVLQMCWNTDAGSDSHYILEKSLNGSQWNKIDEIPYLPETSDCYCYMQHVKGSEIFMFRLRRYLMDGSSRQYYVDAAKELENKHVFESYPKPAEGLVFLDIKEKGKYVVTLTNTFGQVSIEAEIDTDGNIHPVLDFAGKIPAGEYYLHIKGAGKLITEKIRITNS